MSYKIKHLSGERYLDGMLQGSFWDREAIVISLSDGWSGETWNAPDYMSNQLVNATYQMIRYTELQGRWAGIFNNPLAAYDAGSDINLTIDSAKLVFSGDTAWARGFFPNTASEILAGDVIINSRSAANSLPSYGSGSQGFFLLLHELGHALGLKHPHDDGGANRPTFTELDIEEWDFNLFTVMSYNDTNFDLVQYNPATPMILDVLALQHLYGVNTIDHGGNTEWSLVETAHYETVFDPGGTNNLELSDASAGWTVQLPEDTIGTSTTPIGWAHIESGSGLPETFYWLAGVYSQVDGSAQADRLTGSDRNDVINGGSGSDVMRGGLGDDVFDQNPALRAGADQMTGGLGDDAYYVDSMNDVVFELPNEGVDRVHLIGLTAYRLPSHVETLISESNQAVTLTGNAEHNQFDLTLASGRIDGGGGQDRLTIDQDAGDTHIHVSTNQVTLSHRTQGHQLDLIHIETLTLADRVIRLDALQQMTATPTDAIERIATLYTTYFNRAPDADGLRYWVGQHQNGFAIESIAASFYEQPESARLNQLSTERLIETSYQQLFGRVPDPTGAAYWSQELTEGQVSRPQFLLALTDAARSATGAIADGQRIAAKTDLAMYFAWERGLSDVERAADFMQSTQGADTLNASQANVDQYFQEIYSAKGNTPLITFTGINEAHASIFDLIG